MVHKIIFISFLSAFASTSLFAYGSLSNSINVSKPETPEFGNVKKR